MLDAARGTSSGELAQLAPERARILTSAVAIARGGTRSGRLLRRAAQGGSNEGVHSGTPLSRSAQDHGKLI